MKGRCSACGYERWTLKRGRCLACRRAGKKGNAEPKRFSKKPALGWFQLEIMKRVFETYPKGWKPLSKREDVPARALVRLGYLSHALAGYFITPKGLQRLLHEAIKRRVLL